MSGMNEKNISGNWSLAYFENRLCTWAINCRATGGILCPIV